MDREQWLEERKSGIGGSDAAAIAGLSPWKSSFDVYLDKVEDYEKEQTESMKRGTFLEDGVIQWYEDRSGHEVTRNPDSTIYRLESNPIIIGTPDGLFKDSEGNDCLLEVKTVHFSQAKLWGEPGTDAVPDYYLAQVIWYLGILGYQRADVVALIGGDDLRIYTVHFDESLFNILVEKANVFWNEHVLTKIPPEIDNSEGARKWLESKYPAEKQSTFKRADASIRSQVYRLHELDSQMKAMKAEIDTTKAKIKEFIGDDAGVQGEWGRITWKYSQGRTVLDANGVIDDLVANGHVSKGIADAFKKAHTKRAKGTRRFLTKFSL